MSNAAVSVLEYEPEVGPAAEAELAVTWGMPTEEATVGTLKQRTIRSSMWTIVGYGTSQGIRFIRSPVLAYLLFPKAFGLTAIVGMFMAMFQQFSDVGLAPAIIRSERGDEQRFLNTAWTLSILRGVMLFIGTALVAWPVSKIYGEPILWPLISVAGIGALLNGLNSTTVLTLSRHLRMGRLTFYNITGEVVTTGVSVVLAWKTHSVWAIIVGGVAGSAVMLVISHVLIPKYKVAFAWDKSAVHELFHFGKWIFVSTAMTYFANESDRLILGKLVPLAMLGFYTQAVGLARMPWEVISRLVGNNLYPALARCSEAPRGEFATKVRIARSVILPLGATAVVGLMMGAPLAVAILYDYRYLAIGWMAQLTAIGLWLTILQSSADRALLALGKARPLAVTNFVNMALTIVCSIGGFKIGQHFVFADGTNYAIQGLILGVATGNLGGHLVIQAALQKLGISIYLQDLKYTLVVIVMVSLGLLGTTKVIPALFHGHAHIKLINLAWGGSIIGIVGAWSSLRAWRWIKK